ncbi:hypothetical protein V6N13_065013 [Hibiscus sabdariffa]|uniref:Phorbol-ester/DAG-type domain-containing protein n=1 Tax=Hibiscus sabdariffa TaxID=183260 RepID=A0ABR2QRY9_9ROSI
MDIQPFRKCLHPSYRYVEKVEGKCCEECGGKISDDAFACQYCDACLHRSCVVKKPRRLSHEITHPLHLQHRLQLKWNFGDFICDKCLYISVIYRYNCSSCDFNLDPACAFSANDDLEPLSFKVGKKKTILHYSHSHKLSFFKYRKIHHKDYDCFWCEKHLSGVCYGCFDRSCRFYLHQVCSDKIPRTFSHPFHPGHPLPLSYVKGICNACKKIISDYSSPCYTCEMCSFRLHFHCAKLLPTLNLACHPHLLTYFTSKSTYSRDSIFKLYCHSCGKDCRGASICRCDI